VCFPKGPPPAVPESPDGVYRTVFGPSVPHNGITYCKCNDCVKIAMRRMTNCTDAKSDTALADDAVRAASQAHFTTDPALIEIIREHVRQGLDYRDYESATQSAIDHAGDVHPKRSVRLQALAELLTSGDIGDELWLKSVWYKLKTTEIAKFGKYPRMIGDLGVAASLQGFFVTALLKHAQAQSSLQHPGITIQFVKSPEQSAMSAAFAELMDPSTPRFMVLFSDDSSISIRHADGSVTMYNMDIKSCDASHTPAIFQLLLDITPDDMKDEIRILIEQCKLPIRVIDVNDKSNVVLLSPSGPRLYSGSTLTTILNNLANFCIGLAIAKSGAQTEDEIKQAALSVGYGVSLELCETYHNLQFLKHSPCYDTAGQLRAVLNPGVMLRCIGSCHGDLPGRGAVRPRAEAFQRGVLNGLYPRTHFTFCENLKAAVQNATIDEKMQLFVDKHACHSGGDESYTIADEELYRRYDLTPLEIAELNAMSVDAGFEVSLSSSGLDKILQADYGLNISTY